MFVQKWKQKTSNIGVDFVLHFVENFKLVKPFHFIRRNVAAKLLHELTVCGSINVILFCDLCFFSSISNVLFCFFVLQMCFLLTVIKFICEGCFFGVGVCSVITAPPIGAVLMTSILRDSACIANPIIYWTWSSRFRADVRKAVQKLECMKTRKIHPERRRAPNRQTRWVYAGFKGKVSPQNTIYLWRE